jgi:hypothetical protein
MDKLNFLGKLDEEQRQNAEKVARFANEAGIDPDFAVAVAFKESSLRTNPDRGTSGEIGMMQVMPKTGLSLGYDEKKLSNPNQNIKAGIAYLKEALQATENIPELAAIYYNGGPGAVEALRSGKQPDPRVFDYVRMLNSYGTFNPTPSTTTAPAGGDLELGTATTPLPSEPAPSGANPGERFLGGAAGTAAGILAAGRQGNIAQKSATAIRQAGAEEAAREAARTASRNAAASAAAASAATPPAGTATASKPPVGSTIMKPGVTPAAGGLPTPMGVADAGRMAQGQTGVIPYNTAKALGVTDIEAAKALTNTKQEGGAWDIAKKRADALNKLQNMGMGNFVENPMYGGIMTEAQSVGGGPRESFTMKAPVAPNPDLPMGQPGGLSQLPPRQVVATVPPPPAPPSMGVRAKAGLEWITGEFAKKMQPVASAAGTFGKYASGPLAGLSVGLDAAEIANELDKPKDQRDLYKIGLKSLSAASGAASMVPGPHQLLSIPISLGSSLAQSYREDPEYYKQKLKEYTGYSP